MQRHVGRFGQKGVDVLSAIVEEPPPIDISLSRDYPRRNATVVTVDPCCPPCSCISGNVCVCVCVEKAQTYKCERRRWNNMLNQKS